VIQTVLQVRPHSDLISAYSVANFDSTFTTPYGKRSCLELLAGFMRIKRNEVSTISLVVE